MRPNLRGFWRYRPRVPTLILLALIAAPVVLANLTVDPVDAEHFPYGHGLKKLSYGWPLIWHRYIIFGSMGPPILIGWCVNGARLAGNLALWGIMLAVPGASCEWLLRRYRPGLRWSLKTMLAGVALVAASCAWCAAVRNRVVEQDSLVADINGTVWFERRGPAWLDFVGAERYRRHIVGVKLMLNPSNDGAQYQEAEDLLKRVAQLPNLRYLFLDAHCLTPGMPESFAKMRQLRFLSVFLDNQDEQLANSCLAAIGSLTRLEDLRVSGLPFGREGLACLDGLTHLKSLGLDSVEAGANDSGGPLLDSLPPLPCLTSLELTGSGVRDRELCHLTALPRLTSLLLSGTEVTDAGLVQLASLNSLVELAIDCDAVSAAGLEALLSVRGLKRLRLDSNYGGGLGGGDELALNRGRSVIVPKAEADGCRRALEALRRFNPGIVIEGPPRGMGQHEGEDMLSKYRNAEILLPAWRPYYPYLAPMPQLSTAEQARLDAALPSELNKAGLDW